MFNNTRLTPALFFFAVFCLLLPSLDVAQASEGQGDAKMCISDSTRSMKDSSGTEKGINSVLPKKQQIPLHIGNSKVLNPLATQPKMIPSAFIKKGVLAPNCVNVTAANWFVPLQELAGPSVVSPQKN